MYLITLFNYWPTSNKNGISLYFSIGLLFGLASSSFWWPGLEFTFCHAFAWVCVRLCLSMFYVCGVFCLRVHKVKWFFHILNPRASVSFVYSTAVSLCFAACVCVSAKRHLVFSFCQRAQITKFEWVQMWK